MLTDQDKADLKAFLLTLSDQSFVNNPDFSNPFKFNLYACNFITCKTLDFLKQLFTPYYTRVYARERRVNK